MIVGLVSALSSACIYATIFIAAEPQFFCHRVTAESTTTDRALMFNSTTTTSTIMGPEESCEAWIGSQHGKNWSSSSSLKCEFDRTYYGRTIINEWMLVCDQHYKAGLTQTFHILGSIFGFCSGVLGDRFGRRTSVLLFSFALTFTLLFAQLLLTVDSWFALSVDAKYAIYSGAQFLIGFLVNCLYCTAYVLLMEFTTERYRTKIANLNSYIYVLGELIVLAVYYVSRDWHVLNWFVGLYSLAILGT